VENPSRIGWPLVGRRRAFGAIENSGWRTGNGATAIDAPPSVARRLFHNAAEGARL
jgi:hypothetical protein